MPIGALRSAGRDVLRLVRRLHDEHRVNTTCGISNVSFGLPDREGINAAFLAMAISHGLTSAIANPLALGIRQAAAASDVLTGVDRDAARWIAAARGDAPEGAAGRRVNRRRSAPGASGASGASGAG
jgi:5-methyltetrahydrofolate--homocysteine methyltransferase